MKNKFKSDAFKAIHSAASGVVLRAADQVFCAFQAKCHPQMSIPCAGSVRGWLKEMKFMKIVAGLQFAIIAAAITITTVFAQENETLKAFKNALHFKGPESGQILFTVLSDGGVGKTQILKSCLNHEIDQKAEEIVKTNGPYKSLANDNKTAACYEYTFGLKPSLIKKDFAANGFIFLQSGGRTSP
jgi:hypothetical protein